MNQEFMEFAEKVRSKMEDATGKEVQLNEVKKNNGVVLYGISVIDEENNICPTLYLEYYYNKYKNGYSFEEINTKIYYDYKHSEINRNIDMSFFFDYQMVKPLLGVKLINADMNEALLKEVPHKRFLNLAVVCYCNVPNEMCLGEGFITIRNEHIDMWEINAEKLIKDAVRSMKVTNPPELINMADLLRELHNEPAQFVCGKLPMWVLTSKNRQFGAATILYDNCFEHIAEIVKEDYYVLPSSIHEVIILPKRHAMYKDDLVNMVREINEEQLDTEELLANNVYFYSIDTKELQIIE